jgi:hypothetical protein
MKLPDLVWSVDFWTIAIGIVGFSLISIGFGLIYFPAGLIVAGSMLYFWSYAVAKSLAKAHQQ